MIEEKFDRVYRKFKLNLYESILTSEASKKAKLTVTESFCVELIDALENPTVGDLVKYIKVSQPNITYRVNSLVRKGYVVKVKSEVDKRIVHLNVTEKYRKYQNFKTSYAKEIIRKTKSNLKDEEREVFEKILDIMDEKMILNI